MAQSKEERLAKQRQRDRERRERIRAAKIAAGTYKEPSPAQLEHLRRIGFKNMDEPDARPHPEPANKHPERIKLVYLAHLERGLRRSAATKAIGVSTSTVWQWRKADPDFAEAEYRAEEVAAEQIEDALFNSAMNGNTQAQIYWLNNRAPLRWRDQRKGVDVQVTHKGQIEAGDRLAQVGELLSRLESRALNAGPDPDIIDV